MNFDFEISNKQNFEKNDFENVYFENTQFNWLITSTRAKNHLLCWLMNLV